VTTTIPTAFAFLALSLQQPSPPPAQAATAPAAPAAPAVCAQPTLKLAPELDRVLRDYSAAWEKGDEKALAALFSEDGFVLAMGALPVRGRAAIEEQYRASGGGPLALRAIAAHTEGSTGFMLGCYGSAPGGPEMGKFTLTLRKDASGRWLIFSDMDNPNARRR
jgi:ketosteroid isomerase-like protein